MVATISDIDVKNAIPNGNFAKTAARQQEMQGGFMDLMKTPFVTKLSFAPLLRHWEKLLVSKDSAERLLAGEIMGRVDDAPQLWQPIEDLSDLETHRDLVELLLSGLFPSSLRDTALGKVSKPFDMNAFYCTPAMEKMMSLCGGFSVRVEKTSEMFFGTIPVRACALILNKFYGQNLEVDPSVIFTIQQRGSDLLYHYKSALNISFVEVVPLKPLKKLTEEKIHQLLNNIYDLDAWLDAIPPDAFEIHGVAVANLIDMTAEETLSRLRYQLLEKDAVVKPENIARLQASVKSFFQMEDLRLGIMALDFPSNGERDFRYKIRHGFLNNWEEKLFQPAHAYSVYEKASKYKEILLVEDLEALNYKTPVEKQLLAEGLHSFMVSPLVNKDGQVIGIVELGTPNPYQLTSFHELKFKELLPLLSMAVERSREETDNQIEAVIRSKFTAIHPSVEWRFVESAFNYLDKTDALGKKAVVEEIGFDDVYPLYAQADIVSSSTTRNHAIQADFIKNLQLIKGFLDTAAQQVDFPLLHHYLLETQDRIEELKSELRSSDESLLVDFILREIHPLMKELAKKSPAVALALNVYQTNLDPLFGVVYQKRKDYEESVALINSTISEYLEHEEERTQAMVPHYFEKYKTDGVQFELYAGQSLLREDQFNDLHLRNLRLWQLQTMVEITRQMEKLKADMPMPLSTAQLVFVYGQPISIRFRMDDKRFDVDGAYNIRYEIIKKRIDKATIQSADGEQERLTQAGKIAIVYAADKDRQEYMEYLTYLTRQGLIEEAIEDLELEHLQGVQGLRALRVTVK